MLRVFINLQIPCCCYNHILTHLLSIFFNFRRLKLVSKYFSILRSIPESQAKHLITLYFNQLIHGCRNVDCQNRNCASSVNFAHSGITPNQAAALAIELTVNRADLCLSTNAILSSGMSNPSTSRSVEPEINSDDNGGETPNGINEPSSLQTTSIPSSQQLVTNSDTITSGPDEDSFHSLMTPAEVTRLIMFLFDASENDEISSSQLSEPASGIIAEDYSVDHDNSLTSAFRSRNPLFGMFLELSSFWSCICYSLISHS
ncbi:unnamed protein product [Schistosoma margrebowiei]|uniref:Uncharacterized protein n=1 Tax=Schistosoma margrebowiei TaxID=48269 RepID=A0A183MNZ5_9TREM|nr:unnamed protein product [Schistosoma margrebowiei]